MKLSLQIIIVFTAIILITFSCKKLPVEQPLETNLPDTELAEKINNFMPEAENIGSVYRKFVSTYASDESALKTSLPNGAIDTTIWNIEVYLNNKYGFQIDTPYVQHSDYEESIGFTITGYNGSVPIVDGDELSDFLDEKEAEFNDENTDNDSINILNTYLEYDEIRDGKAYITMSVVLGTHFLGVFPPGYDPDNFPHPTSMYAIQPGYGWMGANVEYESRYEYRTPVKLTNANYIYVYWYQYPKYWDSPGVNGRIWHIDYCHPGYLLTTSGSDELNTYLQSTKDVVDDNNPMGQNNIYLGRINIHGVFNNDPTIPYTDHFVVFFRYQKVYIGPPEQ